MNKQLRDIDWSDIKQVQEYAKYLGKGMVVIKHATRDNYNITHASRTDRWLIPGVTTILFT
jgi:hypothetical protein